MSFTLTLFRTLRHCGHWRRLCLGRNFRWFFHFLPKDCLHDAGVKLRRRVRTRVRILLIKFDFMRSYRSDFITFKLSAVCTCSLFTCSAVCHLLTCVSTAYLFVHEGVDQRVIDTRALGEECWDGDKSIIFVFVWWVSEVKSCESVRTVTGDEGSNHDDNHPRNLLLCLLGGDGLRLLGCHLKTRKRQDFRLLLQTRSVNQEQLQGLNSRLSEHPAAGSRRRWWCWAEQWSM